VAIQKFFDRRSAKSSAPRVKLLEQDGKREIAPDHSDKQMGWLMLMTALGTTDMDFLNGFINQLAAAISPGRPPDEEQLNFVLSVVKDIEPRDQVEAMLAAQMALVHIAMMTLNPRLVQAEFIEQQDSAERAVNKFARTFADQMETLKRYRTGGEQKVTVQHVSVQEGGQAIVGNVTQNPRETTARKPPVSPLALTNSKLAPMAIVDEPALKAVSAKREVKR
jgi:hypothetical protein